MLVAPRVQRAVWVLEQSNIKPAVALKVPHRAPWAYVGSKEIPCLDCNWAEVTPWEDLQGPKDTQRMLNFLEREERSQKEGK